MISETIFTFLLDIILLPLELCAILLSFFMTLFLGV